MISRQKPTGIDVASIVRLYLTLDGQGVWSFGSRVHLLLISGPPKQPRGCVPKSITNDIRVFGNMRIASSVWTNSVWKVRRLNERFWIGPSVASWHNGLLVACLMDRWSTTLQSNGLSCRKLQDCRPDWERFGSLSSNHGKTAWLPSPCTACPGPGRNVFTLD
jgi:hypothetical protein